MTMTPELKQDVFLAKAVASGDERAFRVFYDQYADALYRFIFYLLNYRREDAEEVWQETLVAALHGMGRYKGQSRLFSWLCGIARRKAADFYRRNQKEGSAISLDWQEALSVMDDAPLPEAVASHHAVQAMVWEALQTLPEDYREGLIARYAQGCSVEQVAARLKKSYKAAESLLVRARAAFKEAFLVSGAGQDERR